MRSYVVDEISSDDLDLIITCLSEKASASGMKNLYWVDLPVEDLTEEQRDHVDCHPLRFAVEIGDSWIKAEFFIRSGKKIKCDCHGYCDDKQKKYIIRYIDSIISGLNIKT